MFEVLSERLDGVFRRMRGQARLSEENIAESLRDVRRALLEADVQLQVARDFVERVQQRALGQEVLRSLQPGQLFVKIVHEELVTLLGERTAVAASTAAATVNAAGRIAGSQRVRLSLWNRKWIVSQGIGILSSAP